MEKLSSEEEIAYLKECMPILKHMRSSIKYLIMADETLLDKYHEPDMMIKVMANASELDGLYYCGFLSESDYDVCSKIVQEIKDKKMTTFIGQRHHESVIVEPPLKMIYDYMKSKKMSPLFSMDDVDYTQMVQGSAQLHEVLRYNRSNFEIDLSSNLKRRSWAVPNREENTDYNMLFHLLLVHKDVQKKQAQTEKNTSQKSPILLETLIRDFYQRATETLFAEGEDGHADKKTRVMGMGYILSQLAGPDLSCGENRKTMLLTGLVQSVREDIQGVLQSPVQKKNVLDWYDGCTASYLKTVRTHVQKGVYLALKNFGKDPKGRV